MKRLILILFVFCAGVMWRAYDLLPEANAQKARSAKPSTAPAKTAKPGPNYARFTHKAHAGKVKSLTNKSQTIDLNCAYCHGTAVKNKLGDNQHDIENIGYPSHKDGVKEAKAHTACTECHAITGSGAKLEMCSICHAKRVIDPKEMATNIRPFPNPETEGVSQFYDYFSHGDHVDFYDQFITATPLSKSNRFKFFDAKATDPKANKGRDKNKFECSTCHTNNESPVTLTKIVLDQNNKRTIAEKQSVAGVTILGKTTYATGVRMSPPGHPECFICHFDPKIVSPPKPDKPDPKNSFATNCTGCHRDTGKPLKADRPVTGSELALHWFARQIVNTELNPPKQGAKSPLPFSHKTHDDQVGKTVADCLTCHATAKTAATLTDFYIEDRKTKEKQPTALGCVDCHKKDGMQAKIEGAVTLETAKCNYCHSIQTIKAYGAKGVALPPPSHFGKKAIQPTPTPTPTPAPKPPSN